MDFASLMKLHEILTKAIAVIGIIVIDESNFPLSCKSIGIPTHKLMKHALKNAIKINRILRYLLVCFPALRERIVSPPFINASAISLGLINISEKTIVVTKEILNKLEKEEKQD